MEQLYRWRYPLMLSRSLCHLLKKKLRLIKARQSTVSYITWSRLHNASYAWTSFLISKLERYAAAVIVYSAVNAMRSTHKKKKSAWNAVKNHSKLDPSPDVKPTLSTSWSSLAQIKQTHFAVSKHSSTRTTSSTSWIIKLTRFRRSVRLNVVRLLSLRRIFSKSRKEMWPNFVKRLQVGSSAKPKVSGAACVKISWRWSSCRVIFVTWWNSTRARRCCYKSSKVSFPSITITQWNDKG